MSITFNADGITFGPFEEGEGKMGKQYIVISFGSDGTYVRQLDKTELERRLNSEHYGSDVKFFSAIPENFDYGEGLIIIEGTVVVPAQVTTVTKWEMT